MGGIRLVGGSTPNEGRVEVSFRGSWGTICDDGWDIEDGNVVCRELGYPAGAVSVSQRALYGEGNGLIWLDDVECTGSESSIAYCPKRPLGEHNCQSYEDAGVVCSLEEAQSTTSASGECQTKLNTTNKMTVT